MKEQKVFGSGEVSVPGKTKQLIASKSIGKVGCVLASSMAIVILISFFKDRSIIEFPARYLLSYAIYKKIYIPDVVKTVNGGMYIIKRENVFRFDKINNSYLFMISTNGNGAINESDITDLFEGNQKEDVILLLSEFQKSELGKNKFINSLNKMLNKNILNKDGDVTFYDKIGDSYNIGTCCDKMVIIYCSLDNVILTGCNFVQYYENVKINYRIHNMIYAEYIINKVENFFSSMKVETGGE